MSAATPLPLARNWSPLQEAIFAFGANPNAGNLVIEAGAGSGKTTTGKELVRRLNGSHIFLAFNKPIAQELERVGVNGRTFHSLAYSPVLRARGARAVNADKIRQHLSDCLDLDDYRRYSAFVVKLVGLAKNAGVAVLVEDTESAWNALAERHDLELEHDDSQWTYAIQLARDTLTWSNFDNSLDFDDLLYLAVKDGITLPKFDNVLVDEGQDTNAIQIAFIRKLLHPTSRLFVVGDSHQAIYGFRGADSDALDNIVSAFNASTLPLTVSYRCARNIVTFAQEFGAIDPAPNAEEGIVRTGALKGELGQLRANDLIVSRCTKPLIEAAYQLLRARIPCYVMGREMGQGLKSLINKMNAKGVDQLVVKLDAYTLREVEKAIAKNQEAKAVAIQDKTDCVLFLISTLQETDRSVPALLRVIDDLFRNKDEAVILATIHRSKGLEAEKVLWLNFDFVSKWAKQDWQKRQEQNLCYVAATRAKRELVLIPQPKKGREA